MYYISQFKKFFRTSITDAQEGMKVIIGILLGKYVNKGWTKYCFWKYESTGELQRQR